MPKVFSKKTDKAEAGFAVGVILNKSATKGTVGLEIEVEGENLPGWAGEESTPKPWVYRQDGSLRGVENGEYVLAKPLEFKDVDKALDDLWKVFKTKKSVLDDSNRTSVHVHLNCQSFHLNRLTSLMALYIIFEEVLTAWCGDHRVGNLFCMRAKDSPAIVSHIKRFIQADGQSKLFDGLHYSGMNVSALHKFGSLEFRSLRGCSEPSVILNWVRILQRLYELSGEFSDPRDIASMFSREGPLSFFNTILGSETATVRAGITFTDDAIRDSMYEGIRMAQDICYCRDWTVFKAVDLKPDPFDRDPKKIMKKMTAYAQELDADFVGYEPEYDEQPDDMHQMITPGQYNVGQQLNLVGGAAGAGQSFAQQVHAAQQSAVQFWATPPENPFGNN